MHTVLKTETKAKTIECLKKTIAYICIISVDVYTEIFPTFVLRFVHFHVTSTNAIWEVKFKVINMATYIASYVSLYLLSSARNIERDCDNLGW